jgi:uncharacterized protein
VETVDNQQIHRKVGDAPLRAEWRPDLLGGVMVITGQWADGSPLLAIPNFARMNRVNSPPEYPSDREDYSQIDSKVWI